jgi:hypothetical protein
MLTGMLATGLNGFNLNPQGQSSTEEGRLLHEFHRGVALVLARSSILSVHATAPHAPLAEFRCGAVPGTPQKAILACSLAIVMSFWTNFSSSLVFCVSTS